MHAYTYTFTYIYYIYCQNLFSRQGTHSLCAIDILLRKTDLNTQLFTSHTEHITFILLQGILFLNIEVFQIKDFKSRNVCFKSKSDYFFRMY